MIYGSSDRGGLGIHSLYLFQGASHIDFLIRHSQSGTTSHDLIHTSLAASTLELGCSGQLLTKDYQTHGRHLTSTWITHLWQFCSRYQIKIQSKIPILSLSRKHDRFLMEEIINLKVFTSGQLHKINQCRLYLQVTTVSDITTGDGRRITKVAWRGKRDSNYINHHKWPLQGFPGKTSWQIWRRSLRLSLNLSRLSLGAPLGFWLTDITEPWKWFYDPRSDMVFHSLTGDDHLGYVRCHNISQRVHQEGKCHFLRSRYCLALPASSQRCTVYGTSDIMMEGISECRPPVALVETWYQKLIRDSPAIWGSSKMTSYGETAINSLLQNLSNGTLLAVSDGSFEPKSRVGTYATIFTDVSRTWNIIFSNETSGPVQVQSAYRSELSGILMTVVFICHLQDSMGIESGTVNYRCDNVGALIAVFE